MVLISSGVVGTYFHLYTICWFCNIFYTKIVDKLFVLSGMTVHY